MIQSINTTKVCRRILFCRCKPFILLQVHGNQKIQQARQESESLGIVSAAIVSGAASVVRIRRLRKAAAASGVRLARRSAIAHRLVGFQSSRRYVPLLFQKPSADVRFHQRLEIPVAFCYRASAWRRWRCRSVEGRGGDRRCEDEEEEEDMNKKKKGSVICFHYFLSFELLFGSTENVSEDYKVGR